MAKKFTYTDIKTGKIIFEAIEPNHVSIDSVDVKVVQATGKDPRLDPFVNRRIQALPDVQRHPHQSNHRNGVKPKYR